MIKRSVSITVAILAVVGAYAQAPDLEKMDVVLKSLVDGPVAKVQGKNIEKQEFVQLYEAELERLGRSRGTNDFPDIARAELAMMVLRTRVERGLLYNEALELELTVPKESVLKAWDAQLTQLQQAMSQRESREFSENEILAKLGYSEREQILAAIERALLTEKMRRTIIQESDVSIDDEKIQEVYEAESEKFSRPSRLHIKQLYFSPENDSPEKGTARKRAADALSRVYAGQSFDAVAKNFSETPDSARGGDMGMQPLNRLRPFIVEAAMKMKPDDISDIIESEFGFHIIMLVEKQEASLITLTEAGPMIRRGLLAQEGGRVVREHCDTLIHNGAEVKVFLELDKNLATLSSELGKERK